MSNSPAKLTVKSTNTQPLTPAKAADIMEAVVARGDLSELSAEERAKYYVRVCESIGLNPMTKPFEYITLNGRLTLYARKDATDQLRSIYNVSVTDLTENERDGVYVVTCKVSNGDGRTDAAKGAVNINGLKGDALANAFMKAETKAKRRATLSICGLGFLDETEIETIPASAGVGTTLQKKDARDIYTRLQAEIDQAASPTALVEWGRANVARIKTLPDDWQHTLRLRYEENLLALKNADAKSPTATLKDALQDGYPDPKSNLESYLKFVSDKLRSATDVDGLTKVWDTYIEIHTKDIFPPDKEDLVEVFRQKEREFE